MIIRTTGGEVHIETFCYYIMSIHFLVITCEHGQVFEINQLPSVINTRMYLYYLTSQSAIIPDE